MNKKCSGCKTVKSKENFWKNSSKNDGLQTRCIDCSRRDDKTCLQCSCCKATFSIKHRNVKNRKNILCKDCLFALRVDAAIKRNVSRTKYRVFSKKGYELSREESGEYSLSHRKVVELSLGRKLEKGEIVHHIDLNKFNNSIDNLWLTDTKNHAKAHASLVNAAIELMSIGLISFDASLGEYVLISTQKK